MVAVRSSVADTLVSVSPPPPLILPRSFHIRFKIALFCKVIYAHQQQGPALLNGGEDHGCAVLRQRG